MDFKLYLLFSSILYTVASIDVTCIKCDLTIIGNEKEGKKDCEDGAEAGSRLAYYKTCSKGCYKRYVKGHIEEEDTGDHTDFEYIERDCADDKVKKDNCDKLSDFSDAEVEVLGDLFVEQYQSLTGSMTGNATIDKWFDCGCTQPYCNTATSVQVAGVVTALYGLFMTAYYLI